MVCSKNQYMNTCFLSEIIVGSLAGWVYLYMCLCLYKFMCLYTMCEFVHMFVQVHLLVCVFVQVFVPVQIHVLCKYGIGTNTHICIQTSMYNICYLCKIISL